jgi:ABC-type multidrug transport system fused ATPase/permease subunit
MILLAIDRLLRGYARDYRWALALILGLAVTHTALVVLRPLPIKFLTETPAEGGWLADLRDLAGGPDGYLAVFAAMLVAIEGLIFLFRLLDENRSTRLSEMLIRRIRGDVARNLLQGPYAAIAPLGIGRVLAAVTGDVEVIQRLIKDVVVNATIAVVQLTLMLVVVFWIEPTLFVILLVEIVILAFVIQAYAIWRKHAFLAQMENQARYLGWLSGLYQKNIEMRFGQVRNRFLRGAFGSGRQLHGVGLRLWRRQSLYFSFVELFLGLSSAACLVYLFIQSRDQGRPLGDLLVFLYYTVLVFPCLSRIGEAIPLLTDAENAHGRLAPLLGVAADRRATPGPARVGEIRFADVGLRNEEGGWIVRHLDFTIQPGEHVALFGDSGAGKSTIIAMLLGMTRPDEGVITVDGRPIADLTLADRKRLFCFQKSNAAFFRDSVAANVTAGLPVDQDRLDRLLDQALLRQRLEHAEGGLGAEMGERGEPFSQGEQQRIAIARAFLAPQPCLVLDEALNSLDENGETAITRALLDHLGGRTLLMVTHRRTVAELAPTFFYLRRGGVLEIRRATTAGA